MREIIISSLFSAVFGMCLPFLFKYLKHLIRRYAKDNFCGEWFSYSYLVEKGTLKPIHGKVVIQKGIFSLYRTIIYENELKYKGQVTVENNHLLMIQTVKNEFRCETSVIRVDCSQYVNRNKFHGFWLSYDSDNQISCGAILLSKDELTTEVAIEELRRFSRNYDNLILRNNPY